jgi:hypothetical protein
MIFINPATGSRNALVLYGSSPIHSSDEETFFSPPPKGLGFFGAKPGRNTLQEEDGSRSPPSKRTRQGTIGAEDRANMMREHTRHHQQSTGRSSSGE